MRAEGDYFEGDGGQYAQSFDQMTSPVPEIMDGCLCNLLVEYGFLEC
jgi:hypothetical protein